MCPFSILAFLQPTTVDKEPDKKTASAVLFCFLKSTAVFMFQTQKNFAL